MPRDRTTASRWAAVATVVLASSSSNEPSHSESTGLRVLQLVGMVAGALAAAKMWVHNCLESHLVASPW